MQPRTGGVIREVYAVQRSADSSGSGEERIAAYVDYGSPEVLELPDGGQPEKSGTTRGTAVHGVVAWKGESDDGLAVQADTLHYEIVRRGRLGLFHARKVRAARERAGEEVIKALVMAQEHSEAEFTGLFLLP